MNRKIDKVFLIISIILGGIIALALNIGYGVSFGGFASRIPVVIIYLTVFVILIGIIIMFKTLRSEAFVNLKKVMSITLAALIAFIGCSALFEFLYELNFVKNKKYDTKNLQYVFLIDDSGSMDGNDPENKRYEAVEQIINNLEPTNEFAVYSFADETKKLTELGSTMSTNYKMPEYELYGGGTYMITAINDAIDDVADPKNVHTKMIILTDGVPSDRGFGFLFFSKANDDEVISRCRNENTSISSVGFGSPDEEFLTEMADSTGGTYVFSENLSSLVDNLDEIVNSKVNIKDKKRDLLGKREDGTASNVLYVILRILFLSLLGVLWSVIKLLMVGEKKFMRVSLIASIVLCALGAILLEVFTLMGLWAPLVRVIFGMLWGCTVIPIKFQIKEKLDDTLNRVSSVFDEAGKKSEGDSFQYNPQEVGGPKSFL